MQLANLEVGGTKGKVLTTSVAQIYVDFGHAVEAVKNVDYDVMDLDAAAAFEDSYQTFRLALLRSRCFLVASDGMVSMSRLRWCCHCTRFVCEQVVCDDLLAHRIGALCFALTSKLALTSPAGYRRAHG